THSKELLTRKRRLPASIFRSVVDRLSMCYACFLCFLGDFRLRLSSGSYEGDQRITDRLLHRIGGRSVEDHAVDHCLDADAATDELPHCIGHVLVVASQSIDPANHQRVACPKDVEKSPSFRTFAEVSRHARNAMIRQHQIRFKSVLVSL